MPSPLKILHIEDDPDDVMFLQEALKDNKVQFKTETLVRGDLILKWLESSDFLPDLIIMDLNLPKLHGREVICKLRDDQRFSTVPIVVLTTSSLSEDKEYCLDKGADVFISKPASPEGFDQLVRTLTMVARKKRITVN
jgi:DNA-binding response OmpR family regulator